LILSPSSFGGGGCERRDHDNGCRSIIRRRRDGGIVVGYCGIVSFAIIYIVIV
jgi:hypothetical protein